MPPEGSAFFLGYPSPEFVGRIEAGPDDDHLLGQFPAFKPGARPPNSAMVHGRGDGSRAH